MSRTYRDVVWDMDDIAYNRGPRPMRVQDRRVCSKPRCPVCQKDVRYMENRRRRRGERRLIERELEL